MNSGGFASDGRIVAGRHSLVVVSAVLKFNWKISPLVV